MALLWIEGFETRAHSDFFDRAYDAAISGISTAVGGRKHGAAIVASSGTFTPPAPLRSSNENVWVCQFAIRKEEVGELTGDGCFFTISDNVGEQIKLVQVASGLGNGSFAFEVRRGATVLATSTPLAWGANSKAWHVLQFKVTIHPSTGTYDLKHWDFYNNSTALLSATGANTANQGTAGGDRASFGIGSAGRNHRIDDVVIMDGTGGVNDDLTTDPLVVHGTLPDGDGTTTDWLPSSGSDHFALLDDANTSPAGTDEVTSLTTNDIDLLTMAAFGLIAPTSTPTIAGVQVSIEAAMENSGSHTLRARVRSGASESNGAVDLVFATTTKQILHEMLEQNPVTAAAWTLANLNADEFGFELTV